VGQVHKVPLVADLRGDCGGLLGESPFVVDVCDVSHGSIPPVCIWFDFELGSVGSAKPISYII
jgi:hypothetical protein